MEYGVYNFMESWSEKNNPMFISNIRKYDRRMQMFVFNIRTCE